MSLLPMDNLKDSRRISDSRRMMPTYVAVIVVEVIVLIGLWWFQQHFS